jgi:glycosyltransferase involved in cell wall biosynthesis
MKKVLVVSYYFPPAGGVSGLRAQKLVKYLPEFGWHPVVLTARERDYTLKDASLMKDIPSGISVYRAAAPDLYQWYAKLTRRGGGAPPDLSALTVRDTGQGGLAGRVALYVRSLLFVPDARVGWLPHAVRKGIEIAAKERIKAIFTTSPPFTTALIGGWLRKATGLPWISDYRDPWTQAYFYFKRPRISRNLEQFLEKRLLNRADRVMSINQHLLDGLKNKYGYPVPSRQVIIPNGYDPDDFQGIAPVEYEKFTITYTGTLHVKLNPEPLLEAVETLLREQPEIRDRIQVRFIGRISSDVTALLQNSRFRGFVSTVSHMEHRKCLAHMMGADLLLLLIPDFAGNELHVSGKIFEYLRAGTPVLCLSEHGGAADIIRETGAGFTAEYRNVRKIRNILWDTFQRWKQGKSLLSRPVNIEVIARYDRREGAKKLAAILEELSPEDHRI